MTTTTLPLVPFPGERIAWRRIRVSLVHENGERPAPVRGPNDLPALVREFIGDDPREHFVAIYLDGSHRPIAVHDVAIGDATHAPVSPREVFGPAMQLAAVSLVIAHNHTSGSAQPSIQDRTATDRLRQGADLLGIELLDHIILGEAGQVYSFARGGLIGAPEPRPPRLDAIMPLSAPPGELVPTMIVPAPLSPREIEALTDIAGMIRKGLKGS